MIDEKLANLPEDPELAFVEFERRLRADLWENIKGDVPFSYVYDQKIFYVQKLMALHDAHQLGYLKRLILLRGNDDFERLFDEFMDEVTYWTTQLEVRHSTRLRPISTILTLPNEVKSQIHGYIERIRMAIQPLELKSEKKEALFFKLNALAYEVDSDRTNTEAWTAFVLEVASVGGKAAQELNPVRALADSIANLFGRVKELTDRLGLPAPKDRKRLEAPRPRELPAPETKRPSVVDELDDDIPF